MVILGVESASSRQCVAVWSRIEIGQPKLVEVGFTFWARSKATVDPSCPIQTFTVEYQNCRTAANPRGLTPNTWNFPWLTSERSALRLHAAVKATSIVQSISAESVSVMTAPTKWNPMAAVLIRSVSFYQTCDKMVPYKFKTAITLVRDS